MLLFVILPIPSIINPVIGVLITQSEEQIHSTQVTGRVTDTSGNPLIGATVMIVGTPYGAMTDATGCYEIQGFPPAIYSFHAMMVGFAEETVSDVTVTEDEEVHLDFQLSLITYSSRHNLPMKDTVYTVNILQDSWIDSNIRHSGGYYRDTLSWFYSSENIDWYSNPGELRLELEEHTLLDSIETFRELEVMDIDIDGELDILGISIADGLWEYNSVPFRSIQIRPNRVHFIYRDSGQPGGWSDQESSKISPVNSIRATIDPNSFKRIIVLGTTSNRGIRCSNLTDLESIDTISREFIIRYIHTDYTMALNSVDAYDFDGDGVLEYVAAAQDNNKILLFRRPMRERSFDVLFSRFPEMRGNVDIMYEDEWVSEVITDEIISAHYISINDLDCDDSVDVLVASSQDNALTLLIPSLIEDSSFIWHERVIQDNSFHPRTVEIVDINLDGLPDIIAAGDSIGYWLNTGVISIWINGYLNTSRFECKRVHSGDIDGDGDMDIIASGDNGISWFRNDGGLPSSWIEIQVDGIHEGGYQAAQCMDIDEDGILNILSIVSGRITWWKNQFESEGVLNSEIIGLRAPLQSFHIDWDAAVNGFHYYSAFTDISFRFRSSSHTRDMGEWSDTIDEPGDILSYLDPDASYIQYQVLLRTENPEVTPILKEVTLTYSYLDSVVVRDGSIIIY